MSLSHLQSLADELGQQAAATLRAKTKNLEPVRQEDFNGLKTRLQGAVTARLLEWKRQESALLLEAERLQEMENLPLSAAFRASLHRCRGGVS